MYAANDRATVACRYRLELTCLVLNPFALHVVEVTYTNEPL
jgi:hypothetical protein